VKAHLLAFRALLRLYPRAFRDAYARDMELLFVERLGERRSQAARVEFLTRTAGNIASTAFAERWARRRPSAPTPFPNKKGEPMTGFLQDARYAFRLLRRQPAFAVFVVLTLAIGIGANSAVFSVVNGVLLRPLPFDESDRLVAIWGRFDPESGFDFPQFVLSNPEYVDYKSHSRAIGDMAAYQERSTTVGTAGSDPERVPSAAVTSSLFTLLRVQPALGRGFTEQEDTPSGDRVAVVSHGYWALASVVILRSLAASFR
jgi:hypothetical protein